VAVDGTLAYIADGDSGVRIIDVSDPASPAETGSHDTPGSAYGVAVVGSLVYVADDGSGLRIIDVSDPTSPVEIGFCDTPGTAYDVTVVGHHAYVADGWSASLRIIDVSNPVSPVEVGFCSTNDDVAEEGGLRSVDVTDPGLPAEVRWSSEGDVDPAFGAVGTSALPADAGPNRPNCLAMAVGVVEDYAYVSCQGYEIARLHIIDVSDPALPFETARRDIYFNDVTAGGSYAYLAARHKDRDVGGLHVMDISDPSWPSTEGRCDTPGDYEGVAVEGVHAYMADGLHGLRVIAISDPDHPTVIGFYDTPGYSQRVAARDDYVYVADGYGGLLILRFELQEVWLPVVRRGE
jgi:hypothetical protein